jgi:hypothetical protein
MSAAEGVSIVADGLRFKNLIPSAHSEEILKRGDWDGNCA